MDGADRERYAYPGFIRKDQVYIGDIRQEIARARFVPPPPGNLEALLRDFENYINSDDDYSLLIRLAFIHYQFEAIHPFMDGNGRMGRLLITLLLCVHKRLARPLLYLSAYLLSHKQEYYDRLLAVSMRNDWDNWVLFFLNGIIETSKDAIHRSQQLLDLHAKYRQLLIAKKSGDMTQRLLDMLFIYPAFTIPKAAERTNSTYPTVQKAVDKLIAAKILRHFPQTSHPKIFVSSPIIHILESTTLMLEDEA